MELDEVYIPKTREDLGLPEEDEGQLNYSEILGDTPIYTTFYLIRQQLLAFPAYLSETQWHIASPIILIFVRFSLQCLWPEDVSWMDKPF